MSPFAAIDVGSNAIRMVIGKINGGGNLRTLHRSRESIRLGADVFSEGKISEDTLVETVAAFARFKHHIQDMGAKSVKAVATSAVREAKNGQFLVERLKAELGIELDVIDHIEEGRLIHLAVERAIEMDKKNTVLMDIGGGSVEFILSHASKAHIIDSFPIGTVRTLIQHAANSSQGEDLIRDLVFSHRHLLRSLIDAFPHELDAFIGTGGNIVSLGHLRMKILGKRHAQHLKRVDLQEIIKTLLELGYEGRLKKLGLREDRADVIIPAAYLVEMVFEETGLNIMQIPDVGLKDGLVWDLAISQ